MGDNFARCNFCTAAPIVIKDKVISGISGGEFGVRGFLTANDVKTGKQYWKERLGGKKHHASAVAADGRIYLTSDEGVTFVLKAGDEFDILAKNPLGERVFASPAFSDGDIFIRGAKHLWCIGEKR